jgi:predicted dehydrogenase
MRCDWSFPLSRTYGLELGADPDAGTWGPLLQVSGCHAADVCRWCFGDVLTVSADIDSADIMASVPARQRDSVPLLAIFLLGQEQGPATCHFSRSRAVTASERYTFTGSLGHLELILTSSTHPASAFPTLTLHRPGQRPQPLPPPEFAGSELPASVYRMRALLQNLAACARIEGSRGDTGTDARAALEVVHGAYSSTRDSRKIALPLRRSPTLPAA